MVGSMMTYGKLSRQLVDLGKKARYKTNAQTPFLRRRPKDMDVDAAELERSETNAENYGWTEILTENIRSLDEL